MPGAGVSLPAAQKEGLRLVGESKPPPGRAAEPSRGPAARPAEGDPAMRFHSPGKLRGEAEGRNGVGDRAGAPARVPKAALGLSPRELLCHWHALGPRDLLPLPLPRGAQSAAQPALGNAKHEASATRPACLDLRSVRTCTFQSPARHLRDCSYRLSHLLSFLGKTQRNGGHDHVRADQEKGLYSREAQPAAPGQGMAGCLSGKSPPTGPGRALCGTLLIPALFPKVRDHLLQNGHLCSQVCHLNPQLLHLLRVFLP